MIKFKIKLEWIFDYYIAYFLYNPKKIDRYFQYMDQKWEIEPEIIQPIDTYFRIFHFVNAFAGDISNPYFKWFGFW